MKACPAIIAALPREIASVVRGWERHPQPGNVLVYSNDHAVVACAGMGGARAALAVQAAMRLRPITALLSAGVAGACDPAVKVGEIVRAGIVVDTLSGERFSNGEDKQVLVSGPTIAGLKEKQRLFASYSAVAVDMEAATVARIARGHDLPFCAIKAISDDAAFELEELGRFATHDGQFREAAFAAYAALQPRLWGRLIALARNSKLATAALTAELESQLESYRKKG
jgi:adenosylhomocysteine nucleosidase